MSLAFMVGAVVVTIIGNLVVFRLLLACTLERTDSALEEIAEAKPQA